jgi:hypothetical protein
MIVVPPHSKRLHLVVGYSDSLETTSQQAMRYNAIAGINGSFFKMRGADPDDHAKLNGVPKLEPSKLAYNRADTYTRSEDHLIAPNRIETNQTTRPRHQQGTVAIGDTSVAILKADTLNYDWENAITSHDIMTSGPLLLLDGKNTPIPDDDFSQKRHPRTAGANWPMVPFCCWWWMAVPKNLPV